MEATPMKLIGVISTAVLSLTLGVAAPAFAQELQQEEKAKPAQEQKNAQQENKNTQQERKNSQQQEKNTQQEQKSAQQQDKNTQQEQKSAQQQDKNAQQEQRNAQQQDKNNQQEQKNAQQQQRTQQMQRAGNNGGGRIPDDRFRANFGREHSFRVSQTDYSNRRFEYGGYSFGFVDAWPSNWLYTQDVYVIEIDGVYYLCNASYPGVNLVLSFAL
jgi:transcription termination factor Rho